MSKTSKNACICPGSFDPPTYGHLNIVERGLKIFDRVVIAIATNHAKTPLFTVEERIALLKRIFRDEPRVEFDTFAGLLVNYARSKGVHTLLRGIRTVADYEFEFQMSLANRTQDPDVETVFMMTEGHFSHISSSIIKEVIALGGSGKGMVHPFVEEKLRQKLTARAR